jgi:transcriptional regulator
MRDNRKDQLQGTLDLLVLRTLSTGGTMHGYAISERVEQISREVLRIEAGSLYPALHRMENRGLLDTRWRQSETGRDAKYYTITKKGRAELERERVSWRRLARAVSVILRTAEGGA